MAEHDDAIDRTKSSEAPVRVDEPPVVARMVIEIRSDGSRTIARGAMEDVASGERVAVEAEGTTPQALAASMLRSFARLPFVTRPRGLVKSALRAFLPKR